jgi:hypothetical protein
MMRAALLLACAPAMTQAADGGVFFDDFNQADIAQLHAAGWQLRSKAGHPGIEGAAWAPEGVSLVDDPAQPGNRLLRLSARSDGTPKGTKQVQVCHARKYLHGTYAARVRFSDAPAQGPDGDVVVQTFYAVSPLRFDFDPQYSELDWEYLPNGGWGDTRTRLWGVSWQTVRLKPWTSFNQALQHVASVDGWHVLVVQSGEGKVRWFLDGQALEEHGGRNVPVVPMSINFSVWFSPGGFFKGSREARVYQEDVDWVFHARDRLLTPAQVEAQVQTLRAQGTKQLDGVPAAEPALPSTCDF